MFLGLKKKYLKNIFFESLKSQKKGIGSGVFKGQKRKKIESFESTSRVPSFT
jgi:hypothetical protein